MIWASKVSCEMRFICVMPPFLLGGGKQVWLKGGLDVYQARLRSSANCS